MAEMEKTPKTGYWQLNCDGASRGNPGPAGAGAILRDENGTVLAEISEPLGRATNNEAEYMGLIFGLKASVASGAKKLEIRLDSELIVRQLLGVYRVKNERLRPLFGQVTALLQELQAYDIFHVRREFNSEADSLASRAAGKAALGGA